MSIPEAFPACLSIKSFIRSWFLNNPDLDWTPPESLLQWMETARKDEKPIVYIGFGSITVPDPTALTRRIVRAVKESGVRAIISKGWSARMVKSGGPEFRFPPECYSVRVSGDCPFTYGLTETQD